MPGVNLADAGSLALATMDLKLVQDIIGAMRAADAGAAAADSSPLTPLPTIESPRHIVPDPIYEKPRVVHADPIYAPRKVIHPEPKTAPRLALEKLPAEPEKPCHVSSNFAIKPPWAILPWQEPAKLPPRVKVVQYRTDIMSKGSLIDVFI